MRLLSFIAVLTILYSSLVLAQPGDSGCVAFPVSVVDADCDDNFGCPVPGQYCNALTGFCSSCGPLSDSQCTYYGSTSGCTEFNQPSTQVCTISTPDDGFCNGVSECTDDADLSQPVCAAGGWNWYDEVDPALGDQYHCCGDDSGIGQHDKNSGTQWLDQLGEGGQVGACCSNPTDVAEKLPGGGVRCVPTTDQGSLNLNTIRWSQVPTSRDFWAAGGAWVNVNTNAASCALWDGGGSSVWEASGERGELSLYGRQDNLIPQTPTEGEDAGRGTVVGSHTSHISFYKPLPEGNSFCWTPDGHFTGDYYLIERTICDVYDEDTGACEIFSTSVTGHFGRSQQRRLIRENLQRCSTRS